MAWLATCFVLLPALTLTGGLALAASVSEPSGGDLPSVTTTTGVIVIGDTVTGNVGSTTDQDWYGVDLVEGRTYRFDLRGVSSGGGTLTDPFLMGLFNSGGTHFSGTNAHDGGTGLDSRLVHTATYTGRHIVSAAGSGDPGYGEGTYSLSVTDVTAAVSQDTDATRQDAAVLESGPSHTDRIGGTDRTDYFHFTLAGVHFIRLSLRNLRQNADLFLEDESGEVIEESTELSGNSESITRRLPSGVYHVRVAARVAGETPYKLKLESRAATANELRQMYIEADADAHRGGASSLGDLTEPGVARTKDGAVNGGDDPIDYYRFSLRKRRDVHLTLRGQEADADLFLENGSGEVLVSSQTAGASDETLPDLPLGYGTYYVRVEAREAGANGYTLEINVTEPVDRRGPISLVRTGDVPFYTPPPHVTTGHFPDESDTDTIAVNLDAGKTYRAVLELHFSATHAVYESIVSDRHSPLPASQRMVGPRWAEFTFTATHSEEYRFTISAQTLVLRGRRLRWVGGAYTFRVGELASVREDPSRDCADDEGTYCSLIPNTAPRGQIDPSGDVDWVTLPGLEAGRLYEFEVTAGDRFDDLTNVQVRFHNQYGLSVTRLRGISTAISYRPAYSGTHYLQISSSAMGDAGTGPYLIAMTEVVSSDQRHEAPLTETTDCPAATPTCTFDIGDTVDGALDSSTDVDSWLVDLEAGKTYQFDVEGRDGGRRSAVGSDNHSL